MLQNIKVDIIYYLTQTDFEMEFNLCGCCRMRLLTDKASDRKNFVHMLSRAVSRSRVTLCCGNIEGDTGLIRNIALAIGKNTVTADNNTYGIKSKKEVSIIEGSMPLVSEDGVFGGCIIESGPQSIVILTENKAVRKNIMQNLIHPYIEALSVGGTVAAPVVPADNEKAEAVNQEEVKEEITETEEAFKDTASIIPEEKTEEIEMPVPTEAEESEETGVTAEDITEILSESEEEPEIIETEPEIIEDKAEIPEIKSENTEIEAENPETAEEADKKPETEISDSEDDGAFSIDSLLKENAEESPFKAQENADIDLYMEPDKLDPKKVSQDSYGYFDRYEGEDFIAGFGEEEHKKIKYHKLNLPILILSIIVLITLIVLAYLLIFIPLRDGVTFKDYVHEIFNTAQMRIHLFM